MRLKKTHCIHGHEYTPENSRVTPDGQSRVCRTCERDRSKKRRDQFAAKARASVPHGDELGAYFSRDRAHHLKRAYDMTLEVFVVMLKKQAGMCAICQVTLTAKHKQSNTAHVDHCHETQRVRGILCMHCNTALGYLRDSPDIARRAAAYLTGARNPPG